MKVGTVAFEDIHEVAARLAARGLSRSQILLRIARHRDCLKFLAHYVPE